MTIGNLFNYIGVIIFIGLCCWFVIGEFFVIKDNMNKKVNKGEKYEN